jgi:hypothetical protein
MWNFVLEDFVEEIGINMIIQLIIYVVHKLLKFDYYIYLKIIFYI